jgi:hypothetical protein
MRSAIKKLIKLEARFLRHLAANGTIRETDLGTYGSTRLSASLRQKSFKDAIHFMWVTAFTLTLQLYY